MSKKYTLKFPPEMSNEKYRKTFDPEIEEAIKIPLEGEFNKDKERE